MILVAAFGLNAVASFALGLLVARLLGPDAFGRFALGMACAVALNNLAFEWLRLSATRYYSARVRVEAPWIRAALDGAYGRLALALAAVAILAALADPVFGGEAGEIAALAAAAGAAAIGIGLFDYGAALARARFEGGLYGRLVALRALVCVPLMAGAAATGRPALVLAAAALAALAAVALGAPRLADPPAGPRRRRLDAAALGRFAAYAGPLVAANVLYQLLPVVNRGALAVLDGFAQSGQFALAADVAGRFFATLGSALDLALFQLAVRAHEQHGRAAAQAQVARNAAIVAAVLLPFAGGLLAVTPALEALVVPAAFHGAFALYTALLIPGLLALSLISYALNPAFQLRARTGPVIAAALVGLGVDLAGLALLTPWLGAPGVAVAQGLGLTAALLVVATRALVGPDRLRLPWRDLAAALGATLAMTAAVWPLARLDAPLLALGLSGGVGVAIYGGLAWRFDIAGLRGLASAQLRRVRSA